MLLELVTCPLLFFLLSFGLAWPLAARLKLDPAEKVVASAMLSLLATYLGAFAIYVLVLPPVAFWLLPMLAAAGVIASRRTLIAAVRDADARALLTGQLLVTGWCTGWLFFIANYSGGGWTSDWFEHWDRTRFFLERWPHETKFLGFYPLPARPPLANLLTGTLLGLTGVTFSKFQLFMSWLNSLAFLPAALLARRFSAIPGTKATGPRVTIAICTLLLMFNPSFVENTTFAWTKLITGFFILTGLYFFLRTHDPDPPLAASPLCAASLAAGLLAHFSAGPYVTLLAVAWFALNRTRWLEPAYWRRTLQAGLIGGLILASWFGWSLVVYGTRTTLLSNSSVAVPGGPPAGNPFVKIIFNLVDTVVPHFLRPMDRWLIAQTSPWGYWHDWFFQLYQLNLFLIFGSVAWLVIIREMSRNWPAATARARWFWSWLVGGAIVLGVAVHGGRDSWGLAHICLQSLMVLGLAYLAGRWETLGRGWRLAVIGGATIDFCLGIALHFGVQSYALDRWLTPTRPFPEIVNSYSQFSVMNLFGKVQNRLKFFGDSLAVPATLGFALLAGIFILAVMRARRPARR